MHVNKQLQTASTFRKTVRSRKFTNPTAGYAPGYLQGNVVILPLKYAADFLQYCLNNPKPCPLIGLSKPGDPTLQSLGKDIDIRHDIPRYCIYRHGELTDEATDIAEYWADDMVTFVLGCSFTFEEVLIHQGFEVRHIRCDCNVPMFKTNIPTIAGGVFRGPLVVTMRPYRQEQIAKIFDICAGFPHAHGTPIYWGDPEKIGIASISQPDYGDSVTINADEVPVFWACGVTTQAAINLAKPDLCLTHAPGHMLITDILGNQRPRLITGMSNLYSDKTTLT